VHHEEPPAVVPPLEANLMANELWATAVEHRGLSELPDGGTLDDSQASDVGEPNASKPELVLADYSAAVDECVNHASTGWQFGLWGMCRHRRSSSNWFMRQFSCVALQDAFQATPHLNKLPSVDPIAETVCARENLKQESSSMLPTNNLTSFETEVTRMRNFDKVHLVKFTRAGKALQIALHGRELEQVRAHMEEAGHSCHLKHSGASVFLYPDHYDRILKVVPLQTLRPHHVLIADAFLPLLKDEVNKLPSRAKVRPNSVQPFALVDEDVIIVVEKTFYNAEARDRRRAESVTQSSTDAHYGTNPRR